MEEQLFKTKYTNYTITKSGKVFGKSGRELKPQDKGGYLDVHFYIDGKSKNFRTHRLVAETFLPCPEGCDKVYHIDKDYKNNHVSNLKWGSQKDIAKTTKKRKGKAVIQYDLDMNFVARHESVIEIEKDIGLDRRGVYAVCNKKRNKCGGFVWRYEDDDTPQRRHGRLKRVELLDIETGKVVREFESMKKAAEEMKCFAGCITNACHGKLKTYKGYKWRIKKEEPSKKVDTSEWVELEEEYPGYFITKNGSVYSIKRGRFLKLCSTPIGYMRVAIKTRGGKFVKRSVHRLVAQAYIPNPHNYNVINHKNGNKADNTPENLEWCTTQQNCQHAHDTGLCSSKKKLIQYDKSGKELKRFESLKDAEKSVEVTHHTISRVANKKGRNKTAGGFVWRFEDDPLLQDEEIVLNRRKKGVIRLNRDGKELERFDSITDAEKAMGKKSSHIAEVCDGKRPLALYCMWAWQ